LALISNELEFLSVDVRNELVGIFPIGEFIWKRGIFKSVRM